MPWSWILVGVGVVLLVWAVGVALLVASGRRAEARALVRFVPDCVALALRSAGAPLVREHWPGPPESLAAVTALAFGRDARRFA